MSSDGLFLEHALIFGTRPTLEHAVLLAVVDHPTDRCTVLVKHTRNSHRGGGIFCGNATSFFTAGRILGHAVLSEHITAERHAVF